MSYTDSGYDPFFQREVIPALEDINHENVFDFESTVRNVSGNQVLGGLLKSQNGRTNLNLDEENFVVSDGVVERVRFGKLEDDSYGLIIRDNEGNILMQISGVTNLIQSKTTNLQLDFDNERILVKDEGGTPRILLGRQDGGF